MDLHNIYVEFLASNNKLYTDVTKSKLNELRPKLKYYKLSYQKTLNEYILNNQVLIYTRTAIEEVINI